MGIYSSYIAGLNHPDHRKAARSLTRGQELRCERQPDNPHDANAIALRDDRGAMLGYVPAKHAEWLAERLDKNRSTRVVITDVRREGLLWWRRTFTDTEIRTGADTEF